MNTTISSYLRTFRRRSGLSQTEVAFLLGVRGHAKMSRYERLSRRPTLQAAIGLQVIFGLATKDILPQVFVAAEQKVIERAHALSRQLERETDTAQTRRKLEFLATIINRRESGTRLRI
jgi:transcriptional regulator with XRE-family HTH domain